MKDATTDNPEIARHLNAPQYAKDMHYKQEVMVGMTRGTATMIGNSARDNHKTVLLPKVVNETKRTERYSEAEPARKAFSTLAKDGYYQTPNSAGNGIARRMYRDDESF